MCYPRCADTNQEATATGDSWSGQACPDRSGSSRRGGRSLGQRMRTAIPLAVVLAGLVYLIVTAVSSSTMFYLTVDEALARGRSVWGRPLRVSGVVEDRSIVWDARNLVLTFAIRESGPAMPAVYRGPRPDNFAAGAKVILEGRINPQGVFEASKLMMTCPSRYEAAVSAPAAGGQGGPPGAEAGARL